MRCCNRWYPIWVYAVCQCCNRLILYALKWVSKHEPWHEISNNVVCATSKGADQPVHTHSLIRVFASRLNILWLLYNLELLEAAQALLSIHLSKCHIVGNHMSRLNFVECSEQHEDVQWLISSPLHWPRIKCLARWYHTLAYVRLEPGSFGPQFEHSSIGLQRL